MFLTHYLHKPYGQIWNECPRMITIHNTGLLSQADLYIIQILRYELGTCYGNIIIV